MLVVSIHVNPREPICVASNETTGVQSRYFSANDFALAYA